MQKEFELFVARFNELFSKRYRPTAGLLKKYKKRREVFSKEDIDLALTHLSQSSHHTGNNDRGWVASPEFLIRNDEQVDRFVNTEPVVMVTRPQQYSWSLARKHGINPDAVTEIATRLLKRGSVTQSQLEQAVIDSLKDGDSDTIQII